MPTEAYVLISGLGAALISLLAARFSGGVQLRIARDNSAKDIQLQDVDLQAELTHFYV